MSFKMKKLIIGIGNELKSDDNVGNLILEKLREDIKKDNFYFIKGSTNPENFIEHIKSINPNLIFFVDVAFFHGEIGDVKKFTLDEIKHVSISTHNFPITVLQKFLPNSKIFLIGIKPKSLDFGETLTEELKNKFNSITEKVKEIIFEIT